MEAAEIPVVEEHSPQPRDEERLLEQQPEQGVSTSPGAGLTVSLPASTDSEPTAAEADPPRRLSLDIPSSMNSSMHSEWEVVSAGRHSHCGSSPSSVSPSDAFDSEVEQEQEEAAAAEPELQVDLEVGEAVATEAAITAEEQPRDDAAAMALPSAGTPAADTKEIKKTEVERELAHFGSLVLAAEAAAAGVEGQARRVLAAGSEDESYEATSAATDSPRSSYDQPSSRASGHDLYSLSQDGSVDTLSEDDYIGDMMLQGEPDHPATGEPGLHSSGEEDEGAKPTRPHQPPLHALVSAPTATMVAAAHGAYCTASHQLRELADSVSVVLARFVPAAADMAHYVMRGMADIVHTLREHVVALPQGLAPLAHAIHPTVAAVSERMQLAVQRTRKQLGYNRINSAAVAVALSLACSGLAIALYRSWAEQARLATLLAKRESDLSRLLMKVMELQRNITTRSTPLVRHISTSSVASVSATWPAVIVI